MSFAADSFAEIARRQREIAAETGKRIAGDDTQQRFATQCDCPVSPNAHGVEIKVHALGCSAVAQGAGIGLVG